MLMLIPWIFLKMYQLLYKVKKSQRVKALNANCWYSLYLMLKGTILSHNSGCQVSERRLWDCTAISLGLPNWLCYCRPVQCKDSKRNSELWCRRHRALDCDPPPRGTVHTAALWRRWPAFGSLWDFPQRIPTSNPPTQPNVSPIPNASSFPPQGCFLPHREVFSLPTPPFLFIHQLGPAGSWLCVPLSRFTHFSDTRFQHLLCGTTTYPSITQTHKSVCCNRNPLWKCLQQIFLLFLETVKKKEPFI